MKAISFKRNQFWQHSDVNKKDKCSIKKDKATDDQKEIITLKGSQKQKHIDIKAFRKRWVVKAKRELQKMMKSMKVKTKMFVKTQYN